MTPENIRLIGIAALAVVAAYFFILWLLKPTEAPQLGLASGQSTTGAQSSNFGTVLGDVHIGSSAPAVTQPSKSPYGSATKTERSPRYEDGLHGLARVLTGTPPPKPNLPLAGVLGRVYKVVGSTGDFAGQRQARYRKVDLEIVDQVTQNGLSVWGRYGSRALEQIRPSALRVGHLDHKKGTFSVQGDAVHPMVYTDLKFNREEVDAVWPTK